MDRDSCLNELALGYDNDVLFLAESVDRNGRENESEAPWYQQVRRDRTALLRRFQMTNMTRAETASAGITLLISGRRVTDAMHKVVT